MRTTKPMLDSLVAAVQRAGGHNRRCLSALQLGLGWFPEQPGGLDRYFFELLRALPECDVECRGLVVGSDSVARATSGRVQAFAVPTHALIGRCQKVRRAVRDLMSENRFDLVASHFALYAYPSLGQLVNTPFVSHFHGPWSAESRMEGGRWPGHRMKFMVERVVYRRADRVICLSTAFGDILERDYGVRRDRIRVIPGGIDADRFDISQSRFEARSHLGWSTNRPIVLCVRRLIRRMGLENLIEAAGILRRELPDVLIYIAGRGPILQELEERIAAGGLKDTCRLLGFLPDDQLPLAYRGADLTVVPSLALEGFGLVAAESLAAGTPAMVAEVGGLPEVVRPLCPDLVVNAISAESLARGMKVALLGGMSIPSGPACAAYARAKFRWELIAGRIRGVYDEVCGA